MKAALIIFLILDVLLVGGAAYRLSMATPDTPSLLAASAPSQAADEPAPVRKRGGGQAAINAMAGKGAPAESTMAADDAHNRSTNTNDSMDKADAIYDAQAEDLKKAKKKISILPHP